jgi:hypothetical protein
MRLTALQDAAGKPFAAVAAQRRTMVLGSAAEPNTIISLQQPP